MLILLRKLHRYFLLFQMAAWFFILWPRLYYLSLKPARYPGMIRLRRTWAVYSSLMSGIVYRFRFISPIDWSRTYIICSNHTSNLDTSMICALMKHDQFCIMGKAELLDSLVTGIFFRTVDIPVNRDSKISAFRAFRMAKDRLQNGQSLIMFPEGGISDEYPPEVGEFKNGPFRLAIELKIPILPITSADTWKVMWDDGAKSGSRPGICRIVVHEPVDTDYFRLDDVDLLREKVREIILSEYQVEEL